MATELTECYDWGTAEIITYERGGECNGCGACCTNLVETSIFVELDKVDGRVATTKEDSTQKWGKIPGDDKFYEFTPSSTLKPCVYFLLHNHKCILMQNLGYKPKPCNAYPLIPEDIEGFDECGYTFEEVSRREMD